MQMVQVKLQKGNEFQVAWVEKKQCVRLGAIVELKEDGSFWQVVELYNALDADYVRDRERDYTRTRFASDI
jgi:hypothetical protein